ncbi:hypothetical protein BH09PSE2_BH09PSE2_20060 [soil metagenome]
MSRSSELKRERPRPFFVHPADAAPHSGHQVPFAENAEDAALQYVELWTPQPHGDAVKLIVEDCASGHHACFTVHLDTGEAEGC